MVAITFDVNPMPVDAVLDSVMRAISPASLTAFLEGPVHDYFAERMDLRFAYEGDKQVGRWEELADATRAIREAAGYDGASPINIRTGQLEDFVTTHYDIAPTADGAILQIPGPPPSGELERKLRTAQEGSDTNPIPGFGPTPPRPVLAADGDDLAVVMGLLNMHIIEFIGSEIL